MDDAAAFPWVPHEWRERQCPGQGAVPTVIGRTAWSNRLRRVLGGIATLMFLLLAPACGGGGGGGQPPVDPPSPLPAPEPIALFDTIPAANGTIDPGTNGLTITHLAAPGLRYAYSGGCSPSGFALRRSLTDLSSSDSTEIVDHKLACRPAPVSTYNVTVDATGDDGRRYRGALRFSTGNRDGDPPLTVLDRVVTGRGEVDGLFQRYLVQTLVEEIESPILAVLAAVTIGQIAEFSWRQLTARAGFGVASERVSYVSRNPAGERAMLTGLVAMPDIASLADFERKDRVVLLNHATGSTPGSLSFTDSWHVLATLIAGRGYLVVAPDNWGRGGTAGTGQPETYLMANRVANNSLDMLAAVLGSDAYAEFHDARADADVAVVGYSQGGHSAVGVWLANEVGDTGVRIRELYSGGAPHDLYRTFRGALQQMNGRCDDDPWCRNVDSKVIVPYIAKRILPPLLEYVDVGLAYSDLVDDDDLTSDFIAGMLDGDARYDDLKALLQLNSFTNIVGPAQTLATDATVIHLYHSPFDRLVPEQNTRELAELLSPDFDVVFHDKECDSSLYEVLYDLVPIVGLVHVACGVETLDEVLKEFRAREGTADAGSLASAPDAAPDESYRGWRQFAEDRARKAIADPDALARFRAGKSAGELRMLAARLRAADGEDLERLANLLSP